LKKRIPVFTDPFFLQWHITDRCNLNCKHCYRESIKEELKFAELKDIFDNFINFLNYIKKKGRIQFSGGEPLLSRHIFTLCELAFKMKLDIRILSNGTVGDRLFFKRLKEVGVRVLQISVEGRSESHDYIRGEGSLSKALECARLAKEAGLSITFAMTVTKDNYKDIPEVLSMAKQFADRFGCSRLVPIGAGRALKHKLLLANEVKSIFKFLARKKEELKDEFEIPYRDPLWGAYNLPYLFFKRPYIVTGCSAGFNQFAVDVDGTIYPCRRLPVSIGNALKDDFIDVFENSEVLKLLRNRDNLKGKCGTCNIRWYCGGCRAIPYALTGDFLEEDIQCFRKKYIII